MSMTYDYGVRDIWIVNIGDLKLGKIIIFDGIKLNFREIEWKKNCNCKLCSEKSTINSLFQYNI